jgi:hypothetical protein
MACSNNCNSGGIKAVFIVKRSDMKVNEKGELEFKRKYGKFKREVIRIQ